MLLFRLYQCKILSFKCDVKKSKKVFKPELKSFSEDIQELLEQLDQWMKGISKKFDILTEPGGVATKDEGLFVYFIRYVLL